MAHRSDLTMQLLVLGSALLGGIAAGGHAEAQETQGLRSGLSAGREAFASAGAPADATGALVGQAPDSRTIGIGAETDGTIVDLTNRNGTVRQLRGVAGASIVEGSTDAVNGGQAHAISGSIAGSLGGGSTVGADGTVTRPSYAVGGTSYDTVGGAIAAMAALDTGKIAYDRDPATGGRADAVTLHGGAADAPVLVRNVADGILDTDAANVRQVFRAEGRANAYTDASVAAVDRRVDLMDAAIDGLRQDIGAVRTEARRAAAIGLAAGSMRFDDRPGKLSVAAGSGIWKNETAFAFGVGYALPETHVRLNAYGVTSGGDVGAGAGFNFTLN